MDSNVIATEYPRRPVIGILAQDSFNEEEKTEGEQLVYGFIVKFVQMGGALVVPVWLGCGDDYYETMMTRINGLVLPGAYTNDPLNSPYATTAHKLIRRAMELNDAGVYFPIYGVCAGLQTFTAFVTGENLLKECDTYRLRNKLETTSDGDINSSRLLGSLSNKALNILMNEPAVLHMHYYGVRYQDFVSDSRLTDYFHVYSTNKDRKGETIVSTIEAKDYPFCLMQWHADKYSFFNSTRIFTPWSPDFIQLGSEVALFVAKEAMKNTQCFASIEEETSLLIENPKNARKVFFPFREIGYYPSAADGVAV
ncbi:gamma-glutamyl hydrolase-like [Tubulanus polymorphus]|uniref:gamma-glutamyl hydrolase-like n=1 Tax=Tubulanus polymorphus TaxID=672921 RepID=UPI003DA2BAF5